MPSHIMPAPYSRRDERGGTDPGRRLSSPDDDDLAAARGVLFGAIGGAVLWGALIAAWWLL